MPTTSIPQDSTLDSTLALLADPYRFISERCRRHGSDIFGTRLMLRKAVCVMGEEAARVFYQPGRFTRRHAIPPTALRLLQDRRSVKLLEGEAHRRRKRMLMSLMTHEGVHALSDSLATEWRGQLARWEREGGVVLTEDLQEILTRAVCAWAGVPLRERDVHDRTHELTAMYEGAGSVEPKNWWGMLLRARAERWARDLVRQVRDGELEAPGGSALHAVSWHRDPDGELLDVKSAAVELINVLRPTVAVERYVTFTAHALHAHPECVEPLRSGDDEYLEMFVQEVRRFYPFFPAIAGRVVEEFEWRGHPFAEDDWVLLDLYGTNHDPRSWEDPEAFRPERFRRWEGSAYDLVPQGGGDHFASHRCAGEWPTIELMKRSARLLTTAMRYDVPRQDLRLDMSRLPAAPRSGFVISNVRME